MLKIISIVILLLSLTNCKMFKLDQSIFGESNPDEFAIQTNNKLIIPKKFDLPDPTNNEKLTNNNTQQNSPTITEGEKQIIENSNHHRKNINIKEDLNKKPNLLKRIF